MFDDLNDENFMMYAVKCYSAPNCIMSEFESDIKRTKYLKRLFRRYKATKVIKESKTINGKSMCQRNHHERLLGLETPSGNLRKNW